MSKIKAFVAKHFTKLFVKHKNEVWNFAQAGVFRIVSKTFQQICWNCHGVFCCLLPTSCQTWKLAQNTTNSTALCYKCVIMRVCAALDREALHGRFYNIQNGFPKIVSGWHLFRGAFWDCSPESAEQLLLKK